MHVEPTRTLGHSGERGTRVTLKGCPIPTETPFIPYLDLRWVSQQTSNRNDRQKMIPLLKYR